METHKIKFGLLFLLLFVSFACVKKNPDELIETQNGRINGQFVGSSNELFPLKVNNTWEYLVVSFDTMGKMTDSNLQTIRISKQIVLTKTKDTFYNFDDFYFKNQSNKIVIALDTGYKIKERIQVGTSVLSYLGTLAVWEEYPQNSYSYLKYEYYAESSLFTKYGRTCYKTKCQVRNTKGDLIRLVEEYFQPGIGIVAKDTWKLRNEYDVTSAFYLESRTELFGYRFN